MDTKTRVCPSKSKLRRLESPLPFLKSQLLHLLALDSVSSFSFLLVWPASRHFGMSALAHAQAMARAVLGIQTGKSNDAALDVVSHGESIFSMDTTFVEDEPTVVEWFRNVIPSRRQVLAGPRQLFPFTEWIGRYNLQWLYSDLVAGKP
jgi:hypothetical protein